MIKINKDNLIIFFLFFISFFGFYNFHVNIYIMCLATLLIAILIKTQKINRNILYKDQWGYFFFLLVLIITALTSYDKIESFKYLTMFGTIYLCSFFSVNKNENAIKNIFIFLCWIEVICILLQSMGLNFINIFNEHVLPNDILSSMYNNYNVTGSFSGIAGDLPNIMFFSIMFFMYYFICYLIDLEKKSLIISILGLISVFLCGKRSGLIILAISVFLIFLLNMYIEKKLNLKLLIVLLMICLLAIYILFFTRMGDLIVNKNSILIKNGDSSNGRFDLIKQMIEIFKVNPIFGIGSLATRKYYGSVLGHNIYIQVLSENGLIGLGALLYMLLNNFNYSLKRLRIIETKKEKEQCLFSIAIQVFFIIYGFFGNPLYGPVFLIPYIIFSVMNTKLYVENKI